MSTIHPFGYNGGQHKKVIITALLLLLLPVLVFVANIRTRNQNSHAVGDASIAVIPANMAQTGGKWVLPVNQIVPFDVKLTTASNEAVGFSLEVAYDPTVLQLIQNSDPITGVDPNFTCSPTPNIINRMWIQRPPFEPAREGQIVLVCHILTTSQIGTTPIYQTTSAVPTTPAGVTPTPYKVAFPRNTTMTVAALNFQTLREVTDSSIQFSTDETTGVLGWQNCQQDFSIPCDPADYRNNILPVVNEHNVTFDIGTIVTPTVTLTATPPTPTSILSPTPTQIPNNPPIVQITTPQNLATVKKHSTATISAVATDDAGIAKVEFYVNNSLVCTDTTASYSCAWDVPPANRKTYSLEARAYDALGKIASYTISVSSN